MPDKYQSHEAKCDRLRSENQKLLADFKTWLADRGVTERTIRKHACNMDLYLNHYLLYDEPIAAPQGVFHVGMFLRYWYPRKVLCTSETSLRGVAATLGKFYNFMQTQGFVSEEAVRTFQLQVRESIPEGLAKIRRSR